MLRTISTRDEQSWVDELAPDRAADPVGHAAFVHAHPRWIAQAFVNANGGKIVAASAGIDCGTTVAIHLPFATPTTEPEVGPDD